MKKLILIVILFLILLFNPSQSFASGNQVKMTQDGDIIYLSTTVENQNTANSNSTNQTLSQDEISLPTGFATDFGILINALLSLIMILSALLVFLVLILSAFQWITSGGDKGKVDGARNRITAAVIGIIVVSASYAILTLVLRFLGFADLNEVLNSITPISEGENQPIVYQYTKVCGDSFNAKTGQTKCDNGCDALTGKCQSENPYVIKFVCDGQQTECANNPTAFSYSESIKDTACNKTVQINVYDKKCTNIKNEWECNQDNLKDYLVWYSGECE